MISNNVSVSDIGILVILTNISTGVRCWDNSGRMSYNEIFVLFHKLNI